jgi:hypothetical protein
MLLGRWGKGTNLPRITVFVDLIIRLSCKLGQLVGFLFTVFGLFGLAVIEGDVPGKSQVTKHVTMKNYKVTTT